MFTFLKQGGILMLPIVFCSLLGVGLIIEKWRDFQKAKSSTEKLKKELLPLLKNKTFTEAISLCQRYSGLIPGIFKVALKNEAEIQDKLKDKRRKAKDESTERALTEEVTLHALPFLEKHLGILESIARGTPLLGLLGTVVGMIKMFGVISEIGPGEPAALARGIGIALITTAAGLTVAIPAFFVHSYFMHRIDEFTLEIEKSTAWLLRQLGNKAGE